MWINIFITLCAPHISIISFSILFSHGSFLITVQRVWILQTLLRIETFQRWVSISLEYCIVLIQIGHVMMLNTSLCLMQPVGALNSNRLEKFQERYSSFEDPVIPKFHYGSHYSSAGTVCFFFNFIFNMLSALVPSSIILFGPFWYWWYIPF